MCRKNLHKMLKIQPKPSKKWEIRENTTHPSVEVIILDGSVIVNMLRPGSAKTFSDYASQVFLPYVASRLHQASRTDIIWDEYRPDSLKAEARVKRGKGVRRRVEASTLIPGKWQEFCAPMKTKQNCLVFQQIECHASKPKSKFSAIFSLIQFALIQKIIRGLPHVHTKKQMPGSSCTWRTLSLKD